MRSSVVSLIEPPRFGAAEVQEVSPTNSIERALDVLMSLSGEEPAGVTEVARRVGLPKSTTHRLLKTLERRGFTTRVGQQYTLGTALFELGSIVKLWPSPALKEASGFVLHDLRRR